MLDNASPIHAINIRQRIWLRVVLDPRVKEAKVVVEILPQDGELGIGDDAGQLGGIGVAALLVKGIVLGEVNGYVGVKGLDGVLLPVQDIDEGVEDGALVGFRCRARGTVRLRGSGAVRALGECLRRVIGQGEDQGERGEDGEEDGWTHGCKVRCWKRLVRLGSGRRRRELSE